MVAINEQKGKMLAQVDSQRFVLFLFLLVFFWKANCVQRRYFNLVFGIFLPLVLEALLAVSYRPKLD